ncbi:MAG: Holliday junction DNA helicase RuvA [Chlamydiae bacterium RIFCSPHIGHO2_12_FULL_49_9]|nr:MAG: Holliday junction DNA helicase RuvA [Chlamydiae bacterium RIFCSPHIGHO2_12_FULL_49_9]
MYESIKGILKEKQLLKAVVEAGGIGYRLSIPLSTYTKLPSHEAPVLLYLSHVVREDAHTLYAFLDKEERDLFETLITLSGIGPKTAATIIGHIEMSAFQRAVAASDTRLLSKIPGIGKKTAERLVIEMRDKFKHPKQAKSSPLSTSGDGLIGDAISALLNLGYNPMSAQKAVQAALEEKKDETDLGRLISAALKKV